MDLSLSEEQRAIGELARTIFDGLVTPERVREIGASAERFDATLWSELGRAGLLGAGVPEERGGTGGGMLEVCAYLEEAGRAAPLVPAWPAAVATLALGRFEGEPLSVAALCEPGSDDPARPATVALPVDGGWMLDGAKTLVPYASVASRFVTTALTAEGPAVFVFERDDVGIDVQRATTNEPHGYVTLAKTPATLLPGDVAWLRDRALVAMCAYASGLASRALRLTAAHVSERVQFERPLGTFQAVQQRLADAYIDVEAMRWTMWQAAWRLDEGLPAEEEVAVAKFWAADGGHRVHAAAQHLHGGIGVDVDYPLHRYTRAAKLIEMSLGGASRQLARLGDMIGARA